MNEILIKNLSVYSHVGVPDEERAHAQKLLINAVIEPAVAFGELNDEIARTVDYDAAAKRITAVAADHPRRLIETLASEVAEMLIREFPAKKASVEIRKFILPNTEYVAVRCTREWERESC